MDQLVNVPSELPATCTPEELLAVEEQRLNLIAQRIAILEKCLTTPTTTRSYGSGPVYFYRMPDGPTITTNEVGPLAVYTSRLNSLYAQLVATQDRIIEWKYRKVCVSGLGI